jgi:cysteine desulfurase
MSRFIYFDHAATTPLDSRVLEAMLPYLGERFGNPSATYALAREAQRAVEQARRSVADVLGCRSTEVVFTSGGSESINTALKGVAFAQKKARVGDHVVTTAVEHHAVLHTCEYLEKFGFEVTYVPVDRYGLVDPDEIAGAVNERTVLVSVMAANNEVGTIEPVAEVAQALRERGRFLGRRIPLHTDAVQAPGILNLNVEALGVDLLSLSAHKFYGPKGAGVLYLRRGTPFLPQQSGGGQERQRRAGTENVAGIVGTGLALRLAEESREADSRACRALSRRLAEGILERIPNSQLNGHPEQRLANNVNLSFRGVKGEALLARLDKVGVAASSGAACGDSSWEPSHVLLAMGIPMDLAVGSLRLTLGPSNTEKDVDYLLHVLPDLVRSLRDQAELRLPRGQTSLATPNRSRGAPAASARRSSPLGGSRARPPKPTRLSRSRP